MGKPANDITDYLLLHLSKEIPNLDVWRSARVDAMARSKDGRSIRIKAGEDGQADLTGHYGVPDEEMMRMVLKDCDAVGDFDSVTIPLEYVMRLALHGNGRKTELEIKAPGDGQRQTQKDFERRCVAHGSVYLICSVKKQSTVEEIRARLSAGKKAPAGHPAEIQAFIDELRRRLVG